MDEERECNCLLDSKQRALSTLYKISAEKFSRARQEARRPIYSRRISLVASHFFTYVLLV